MPFREDLAISDHRNLSSLNHPSLQSISRNNDLASPPSFTIREADTRLVTARFGIIEVQYVDSTKPFVALEQTPRFEVEEVRCMGNEGVERVNSRLPTTRLSAMATNTTCRSLFIKVI